MATTTSNNQLPVPTETQEQQWLIEWAHNYRVKYPALSLLYHVPNGGSRHKAEARALRRGGVKAGVPDLCLPVPRGYWHGLYIELKRTKGGRVSDAQREWLDALALQGYRVEVCEGWRAAADVITGYLDTPIPRRANDQG
jgi:hypothetical protein